MAKLQKVGLLFVSLLVFYGVSAHTSWAAKKVVSVSDKNMNTVNNNSIEAISAVEFDGEKIKLSVLSFGCTNAADFQVQHAVSDNRCNITIVRTKPDFCRRAPFVANIEIEWSLPKDCTDMTLQINNPILVTQAKGSVVKRMK